mmetsp:Transcript_52501/g.135937  ORF Transcript_52501/g.135937 Transcript_52501/m.135937 type:complete len:212 (+) Transcript_52501:587-1222(+)
MTSSYGLKAPRTFFPLFWLCVSGKMLGIPVSTATFLRDQNSAMTPSTTATTTQHLLHRNNPFVAERMRPVCLSGRRGSEGSDSLCRLRMWQQPQKLSSKRHTGSSRAVNKNHTSMTHKPMKKPNSRKGLSTEARLAKNDTAVVADVTSEALPAWYRVQLMRPFTVFLISLESLQKSVNTKTTSLPKPTIKNNDKPETTCICVEPVVKVNST